MRKVFPLALALALALTGCGAHGKPTPAPAPSPASTATPAPTPTPTPTPTPAPMPTLTPTPEEPKELWGFPIDDTHDAFEVPTGGRLGTVLVTVELLEESREDGQAVHLQVWDPGDLRQPLQELDSYTFNVFHWSDVVDANFDGYMDFGYMHAMGNQPCYWHYWIWNEDEGQFVAEPEFDEISWPAFDAQTGIISGYSRDGFAGAAGTTTFHQWIDGKLVCIRRIRTDPYGWDTLNEIRLTVEEPTDGVLTEIYRHDTDLETAFEEVQKWSDLDYHG